MKNDEFDEFDEMFDPDAMITGAIIAHVAFWVICIGACVYMVCTV
jgi:hypothetical protein